MTEKKQFRLSNIKDVKRLLHRIANEVYTGELSPDIAKVMTSISNTFIKAFEVSEIENKVEMIEQRMNEIENAKN